MKKILLLIIALVCLASLVGCENTVETVETVTLQISSGEVTKIDTPAAIPDEDFANRTNAARELISSGDVYGIEKINYNSKEHFVEDASLKKIDDNYVLTLTIASSAVFDKEEVDKAQNEAQEKGKATYNDFEFYKDNRVPIDQTNTDKDYQNAMNRALEGYKDKGILATHKESGICLFMPTPNDPTKYCVAFLQFAGATREYGTMFISVDGEMDVTLLPTDKIEIVINNSETDRKEYTVENFYDIASSGDMISFRGFDAPFVFNLTNLGNSRDTYGTYQNAVEFTDKVVINYTFGGI